MLDFIKSKSFFLNLSVAVVLICLLLYGLFAWLDSYTHHGEKLPLPDLTNKSIAEAKKILAESGLQYTIEDSVYAENIMPGMVVSQVPNAYYTDPKTGKKVNNKVKEGRRVYLTINKLTPPKINMPEFVGKSKRMALMRTKSLGLEVEIKYKTNATCDNCVLEQLYNGRTIKEGEKIARGSKITLVLGKQSTKMVYVPDLTGLTVINAQHKLNNKSLNMGRISGDCTGCETKFDTLNAYITKQIPAFDEHVKQGEEIDIQISTEEP